MNEVRIDKWMWATRVFKTRSIAADACKKGRVSVGGVTVKPSRMVKVGEVIQVRKPPITFSFKVLDLIVDTAIRHKLGARGLRSICEAIMTDAMYEAPTSSRKEFRVTLDYAKKHLTTITGEALS